MNKSFSAEKHSTSGIWMMLLMLSVVVLLMPAMAHASTSAGTQFQSLYSLLVGWVTGIPGIMAAIVLMLMGLYLSFLGGKSVMYFFGTALAAAAIFLIPTIAGSLGGAVW
jgi:conjugal transfer pilus assembly protein TraA